MKSRNVGEAASRVKLADLIPCAETPRVLSPSAESPARSDVASVAPAPLEASDADGLASLTELWFGSEGALGYEPLWAGVEGYLPFAEDKPFLLRPSRGEAGRHVAPTPASLDGAQHAKAQEAPSAPPPNPPPATKFSEANGPDRSLTDGIAAIQSLVGGVRDLLKRNESGINSVLAGVRELQAQAAVATHAILQPIVEKYVVPFAQVAHAARVAAGPAIERLDLWANSKGARALQAMRPHLERYERNMPRLVASFNENVVPILQPILVFDHVRRCDFKMVLAASNGDPRKLRTDPALRRAVRRTTLRMGLIDNRLDGLLSSQLVELDHFQERFNEAVVEAARMAHGKQPVRLGTKWVKDAQGKIRQLIPDLELVDDELWRYLVARSWSAVPGGGPRRSTRESNAAVLAQREENEGRRERQRAERANLRLAEENPRARAQRVLEAECCPIETDDEQGSEHLRRLKHFAGPRERELLAHFAEGLTRLEAAMKMGISPTTARVMMCRLRKKSTSRLKKL